MPLISHVMWGAGRDLYVEQLATICSPMMNFRRLNVIFGGPICWTARWFSIDVCLELGIEPTQENGTRGEEAQETYKTRDQLRAFKKMPTRAPVWPGSNRRLSFGSGIVCYLWQWNGSVFGGMTQDRRVDCFTCLVEVRLTEWCQMNVCIYIYCLRVLKKIKREIPWNSYGWPAWALLLTLW